MPIVACAGVTHRFAGAQETAVLDGVDVEFDQRRVGVIGANGSGKSTFVRLLNALVVPSEGTVTVDGADTRRHARRIRHQVGFCFTNPDAQIVMPTVAEDLAFGLRGRGMSKTEVAQQVADAMETFGLTDLGDRPAHRLSGGQKQLLALAAVLITSPELVVMDEPTTLLDRVNERRIRAEIDRMSQQVVLVTHHLHLLDGFDRVLVFDRGRLVCDDAPGPACGFYRRLCGD